MPISITQKDIRNFYLVNFKEGDSILLGVKHLRKEREGLKGENASTRAIELLKSA